MKPLHRLLGLKPEDMADVILDIAESLKESYPEIKLVKKLLEKYEGIKLSYSLFIAGKFYGMLSSFNFPHDAQAQIEKTFALSNRLFSEERDKLKKEVTREIEEDEEYLRREMEDINRDVV